MNSFNTVATQAARRFRSPPPPPRRFSQWSTSAVPNSSWCSDDFMLGAGMVVIQPSTHKLVVLYDTQRKCWFLPKGRKDVGESLEQAALREAYEESGYQVEFLPLYMRHHAPAPPHDPDARYRRSTEPIFVSLYAWGPRRNRQRQEVDTGGEYLTSWYVGQIPGNAVREEGTGMPDEQNYTAYLFTLEDALSKLGDVERRIMEYAWCLYTNTLEHEAVLKKRREEAQQSFGDNQGSSSSNSGIQTSLPASEYRNLRKSRSSLQ